MDRKTTAFLTGLREAGLLPLRYDDCDAYEAIAQYIADINGEAPPVERTYWENIGGIDTHVIVPTRSPLGTIVYFHGASVTAASVAHVTPIAQRLADRTSCTFVLPEYRDACRPEYPTSVEDAALILAWAADRSDDLAYEGAPLIVGGEGLGAAVALLTSASPVASAPPVAMQLLAFPMLDPEMTSHSYKDPATQVFLTTDSVRWQWDRWMPDLTTSARRKVFNRVDPSAVPPSVIVGAELDPLRHDAEAFAFSMREAGASASYRQYPAQIHGFMSILTLRQGERSFQQIVSQIRKLILPVAQARAHAQ